MKLGIFGVGRSGTTALYVGVQHMVLNSRTAWRFLYEPYLWSHRVFDAPFSTVAEQFQSTAALSVEGMYAHCTTPLFTDSGNAVHDRFLAAITEGSSNILFKTIRANGRLQAFLEAFPDFKAVVVIRNPLDTINSVINRFSFFGDEFHPSDKSRFIDEVSRLFSIEEVGKQRNEVEWSLLWWQYMNHAALKTAKQHQDRCLVLSYEAFNHNPIHALQYVGDFFGLNTDSLTFYDAYQPVGEVSKQVHLRLDDINCIRQHEDEYWQGFIRDSAISLNSSRTAQIRTSLNTSDEANISTDKKPQSMQIPTDRNPLLIRRHLLQTSARSSELQHVKEQLQHTQSELKHTQGKLLHAQSELQHTQAQLQHTHFLLQQAQRSVFQKLIDRSAYNIRHAIKQILPDSVVVAIQEIKHQHNKLTLDEQQIPSPISLPKHYQTALLPVPDPPRISIVTPSYNQVDYIGQTIKSIIDQDYPNLEYFVQDGASLDGTQEVLKQYTNQVTKIVSEPDSGQADAINRGFAHTSGEIMAWLNSDDLLLPGSLNYVANYFASHPKADVVYGHRILINRQDQQVGQWVLPSHSDTVLAWADYIPQETMFWRRTIWDKAGGYVDESFRFALDWDLVLRFRQAGAHFVRLPRFLGAFRVHPQQKTSAWDEVGQAEMARLRERCHQRKVTQEDVNDAIRPYHRQAWRYYWLHSLNLLNH
ncbi:MAG: glycosyltransferase [Cyanobacteria bacterium P01_D01_bin.1]